MHLFLLPLIAASTLCAAGRLSDGEQNLQSLLATERAFAQMSVEMGMDTAFLANLADYAKLLRPGPVNGKMWIRLHPNTTSQLSWEPKYAVVSEAGDLGYTTGPWMSKSLVDSTRPPRFGHFVSLWRRDKTGKWKLEFDMGIVHDIPGVGHLDGFAAERERMAGERRPPPASDKKCEEELLARDQQLATDFGAKETRLVSASWYLPHALAYRMGALPLVGRDMIHEKLLSASDTLYYTPLAAAVSRSCDLGYTYGSVLVQGTLGYYLRIWRPDPEGVWRVVLDLDNLQR
jgi:hypothetical protein